jgi:RNase adapter protein RapZ
VLTTASTTAATTRPTRAIGDSAGDSGSGTAADLLLVTGMSGAGRSAAVDHLGDLGWYAVDNLPVELIPATLGLAQDRSADRVAVAVGPHSATAELPPALSELRSAGTRARLVFLDAGDEALVRRFAATGRRHPLAGPHGSLLGALDRERRLLAPVRSEADVVLDTSELSVHELRRRMRALVGREETSEATRVTLVSFGFKHGIPLDADVVLDCRFLANPQYVEHLRPRTGLDPQVRDYVLGQDASAPFLRHVEGLLAHLLPAYAAVGRDQLTVALGCTGGRHRSVALTVRTAAGLRQLGYSPGIRHRDVDR